MAGGAGPWFVRRTMIAGGPDAGRNPARMAYNFGLPPNGPTPWRNDSRPAPASSRSRKAPSSRRSSTSDGLIPAVTTDFTTGELLMHGLHERRSAREDDRDGRGSLLQPQPPRAVAQRRDERARAEGPRAARRRRSGLRLAARRRRGRRELPRRLPLVLLPPRAARRGTAEPLEFTETEKVFDPEEVYGDAPNPTQL